MMKRLTRRELELLLEGAPVYSNPSERLEQYFTPSHIASKLLWEAAMKGDIGDRTVADLGCGTLKLGLGALYLGCRRVVGVDIDCRVLEYTLEWLRSQGLSSRVTLVCSDVAVVNLENIDTVVMNPPFGVKRWNRGVDMLFLRKALTIAEAVYSIHKYSIGLNRLIGEISKVHGTAITYRDIVDFPIKMMYRHHRKRIHRFKAVIYGFRRWSSCGEETDHSRR